MKKKLFKLIALIIIIQFCLAMYFNYMMTKISFGETYIDDITNENIEEVLYKEKGYDEKYGADFEMKFCKIYYYDFLEDKIVYENRKIKNDYDFLHTLLLNLEIPPRGVNAVIVPNIIGEFINKENDILTVNFNEDFTYYISNNTDTELKTIQAITNTLCYAFGVSKVQILIGYKPYESNNIIMIDNQYFTMNEEGVVEIQKE